MRAALVVVLLGACSSPPPPEPPPRLKASDFEYVHTPGPRMVEVVEPEPEPEPPRDETDQEFEAELERQRLCDEQRASELPPLTDEQLDHAQWVREHCTPLGFDAIECEARCRGRRCEAQCADVHLYPECPLVECPEGTAPEWTTWYYRASCQRQARLVDYCGMPSKIGGKRDREFRGGAIRP